MKFSDRSKSAELLFPLPSRELNPQILSYGEGDTEDYRLVQKRLLQRARKKKSPNPKQKNVGYIDQIISRSPTSLTNKLHEMRDKFFKNLTKNYKPNINPKSKRTPVKDSFDSKRISQTDQSINIDPRSAHLLRHTISREYNPLHEPSMENHSSIEDVYLTKEDKHSYYRRYSDPEVEHYQISNANHLPHYNILGKEFLVTNNSINSINPHESSRRSHSEMKQNNQSRGREPPNSLKRDREEMPESLGSRVHNKGMGQAHMSNSNIEEENCNYALIRNFGKEAELEGSRGYEIIENENFSFRDKNKKLSARGKLSSYNYGQPDPFHNKSPQVLTSDESTQEIGRDYKGGMNPSSQQSRANVDADPNLLYNGSTFGTLDSTKHRKDIYHYIQTTTEANQDRDDISKKTYFSKGQLAAMNRRNTTENTDKSLLFYTKSTEAANTLGTFSEESKHMIPSQLADKHEYFHDYLRHRSCVQMFSALEKMNLTRMHQALMSLKEPSSTQQSRHSSKKVMLNLDSLQKINTMVSTIRTKKQLLLQSAFERLEHSTLLLKKQKQDSVNHGSVLLSKFFNSQRKLNLLHSVFKIKLSALQSQEKVTNNSNAWMQQSPPLDKEVFFQNVITREQRPMSFEDSIQQEPQLFLKNTGASNELFHLKDPAIEQRLMYTCVLDTGKENLNRGPMDDYQPHLKQANKTTFGLDIQALKKDFFKDDIDKLNKFFIGDTESSKESRRSQHIHERALIQILGAREQNMSPVKASAHTTNTKCSSSDRNDQNCQSNAKVVHQESSELMRRHNIRPHVQSNIRGNEDGRRSTHGFANELRSHTPDICGRAIYKELEIGQLNRFSRELYGENARKIQSRIRNEENQMSQNESRFLNISESEVMNERTQSSKRIREITNDFLGQDLDNMSSVGSERTIHFEGEL